MLPPRHLSTRHGLIFPGFSPLSSESEATGSSSPIPGFPPADVPRCFALGTGGQAREHNIVMFSRRPSVVPTLKRSGRRRGRKLALKAATCEPWLRAHRMRVPISLRESGRGRWAKGERTYNASIMRRSRRSGVVPTLKRSGRRRMKACARPALPARRSP